MELILKINFWTLVHSCFSLKPSRFLQNTFKCSQKNSHFERPSLIWLFGLWMEQSFHRMPLGKRLFPQIPALSSSSDLPWQSVMLGVRQPPPPSPVCPQDPSSSGKPGSNDPPHRVLGGPILSMNSVQCAYTRAWHPVSVQQVWTTITNYLLFAISTPKSTFIS